MSAVALPVPPLFDQARLAVAGFLARYSGPTRTAFTTDLRQYFAWCAAQGLDVFAARRGHLELWARSMEEAGPGPGPPSAVGCPPVSGFYRFTVVDGLLAHSPAEFVRRPKISTESATLGLDRMELGAFIACGAAGSPTVHALACLYGRLGLRVSEACSTDVEDLGMERGHRIVTVVGKGSKLAVIPLPPRIAEHSTWPPASAALDRCCWPARGCGSTATPPAASCADWPRRPGSPSASLRTP